MNLVEALAHGYVPVIGRQVSFLPDGPKGAAVGCMIHEIEAWSEDDVSVVVVDDRGVIWRCDGRCVYVD